jgi:tetratricopeptide (TPR) repeat protein
MRALKQLVLAICLWSASPCAAADKPLIAPPPDWVKPVGLPAGPGKSDDAPVRLLLADQQVRFGPGKEEVYSQAALRIQTPQGLSAGNLSFPWNPETEVLTVHKLVIHRGDTLIDILGGGQSFTVVRREPNLEHAMLDGVLTANIQPEGLQVGDILAFSLTMTRSDPVLRGHVEEFGADWNGLPIDQAHIKVSWPNSLPIHMRQTASLPPVKPVKSGGMTSVELSLQNVEPIIPPRGAPVRYGIGRLIEFSDFKSWADLGALMAPLYAKASLVPAQGPLRVEVEKIKAASADPVARAEAALLLVQDRVRYVALLMGAGGYVPADAAETWGRRYGDCKGKTALLLALLHELGIAAEPVAVNLGLGDGFDQRLPMIGLFNHVLVQAQIGGKAYWLDGTRTGDTSLARLRVPHFGWGLPLVAKDAALVRMVPAPLEAPEKEMLIDIDASGGLTLPAPTKATIVLRGDSALATKLTVAQLTGAQRDELLRRYMKSEFDDLEIAAVSARYDAATGEEILVADGTTAMEWKDGWFYPSRVTLGFDADFDRPTGPDQDAPYAVDYPEYLRTLYTVKLPPGFVDDPDYRQQSIDETIAGTSYRRTVRVAGNVYTVEAITRAVSAEFPASEAPAARKALKAIYDKRVSLRRVAGVRMTEAEVKLRLEEKLTTASALIDRGNMLLDNRRFADALVDFSDAIEMEPKNSLAMAQRALALVWLRHFDEAAKHIEAALALNPKQIAAFRARGMMGQFKQDYRAAIAAFSEVLGLDPSDAFSLGNRAIANMALNNNEAALADAERALKLSPWWIEQHGRRMELLLRLGRPGEAVAAIDAMVAANAENLNAALFAALAYRQLKRMDLALKLLDPLVAAKPQAAIYIVRADVRDGADVAGRMADLEAALALEPKNTDALLKKLHLQVGQADYANAVAGYTALIERLPGQKMLHLLRGIAYAKAGDIGRSREDFAMARDKTTDAGVLNNLCWTKAISGVALEIALEECDAALVREADSAAILDSRAFVLLRLGRLDDAIAGYDKALLKAANLPTANFGRAIAWSRKGDQAKADADFSEARKLRPLIDEEFARYGVTP